MVLESLVTTSPTRPELASKVSPQETLVPKIKYLPPLTDMLALHRSQIANESFKTTTFDFGITQNDLREILDSHTTPHGRHFIDAYNPAGTLFFNGQFVTAARVEPRPRELSSLSIVFTKTNESEGWKPFRGRVFRMQDPSLLTVGDEIVLSGIRLDTRNPHRLKWKTVFYRGKSIATLKEFAQAPGKDNRLLEANDRTIDFYNRPQGYGNLGQIGYINLPNLDSLRLSPELIRDTPLLETRVPSGEWWGSNHISRLQYGFNFVLLHRAAFIEGEKTYAVGAGLHNPQQGSFLDLGILAERRDFSAGPSKRPDLENILFPSEASFNKSENIMTIKVGTSDCQIRVMKRSIPELVRELL